MCEGDRIILDPGESFMFPKKALHTFYSPEVTNIKFKATFSPSLNIQYILTEVFKSFNRRRSKDQSIIDGA